MTVIRSQIAPSGGKKKASQNICSQSDLDTSTHEKKVLFAAWHLINKHDEREEVEGCEIS